MSRKDINQDAEKQGVTTQGMRSSWVNIGLNIQQQVQVQQAGCRFEFMCREGDTNTWMSKIRVSLFWIYAVYSRIQPLHFTCVCMNGTRSRRESMPWSRALVINIVYMFLMVRKTEYHWGCEETQTDMNVQRERPKVRTGIQNLPTQVPTRCTQTNLTGNACEGNFDVVTCDLGVIKDT